MKAYLQIPGWFKVDFNVSEAEPKKEMVEAFEKDGYEIVAEFNLDKEQIEKMRKACQEFLKLTETKNDVVAGLIYKEKEAK